MIAPTIDKKGRFLAYPLKYRSWVFAHKSPPPQEAKTRASARFPVRKQHSTAASKFPTISASFTTFCVACDMGPVPPVLPFVSSLYADAFAAIVVGSNPRVSRSCCLAFASKITRINRHNCVSFASLPCFVALPWQKATVLVGSIAASNSREIFARSGSSTTVRMRTILSVAPHVTIAPPNAHETLLLGRIHFGGRPDAASPSIEWASTFRSSEAVDTIPRLRGDHWTSYLRCCDEASPNMLCSCVPDACCASTGSLGMSPMGAIV
mmetsp:Transcript_7275/g.14948  ORF Transcript_7275/g.14948 Transcript_7275/m.14948 type:complete len:266 (+) Transcript_7275:2916-3713(+)